MKQKFILALLSLCFILQGTKSATLFGIWSIICLLGCLFILRPHKLKIEPLQMSCLATFFIAWVLLALVQSLDFSQSLFPTLQCILYVFFAALLVNRPFEGDEKLLWTFLSIGAGVTALLTSAQTIQKVSPCGWLPINPNFNAVWMASLSVVLLYRKDYLHKVLGGWLALLVLMGHSRSALLGWLLGMAYLSFKTMKRQHFIILVCSLIILVFAIPSSLLIARLRLPSVFPLEIYRLAMWKTALKAIADYPLTGYGLGNFELAYQRHAFPVIEDWVQFSRTTAFAHNEYLQMAVELGIPALAFLLLCSYRVLKAPVDRAPHLQMPAKAALLILGTGACLNPIWHMPILVFMTLLWGSILLEPDKMTFPINFKMRILSLALTAVAAIVITVRGTWASGGRWEDLCRVFPYDSEAAYRSEHYAQAVSQSFYNPYYHEALAKTYESSTQINSLVLALKEYQYARVLAPSRAINSLAIGKIILRLGDSKKAFVWFQEARRIEPFYWEADLWIARCFFLKGNRSSAIYQLLDLSARHRVFVSRQDRAFASPYESAILSYDESTVQKDLRRFLSKH